MIFLWLCASKDIRQTTLLTSSVYMCENFVAYLFYAYFNDSYNDIEYNDMVFCREKLTN